MSNGTDENTNFGRSDGATLKEYLETLIEEQISKLSSVVKSKDELYMQKFADSKEAVANAFESSQTAITKSELTAEKRADAVYVSLAGLQKALSEVVSRGEFALSNKNIDDKYAVLDKSIADLQLASAMFLTGDTYEIRHAELQKQIDSLKETRPEGTGKGIATTALIGWIFGAIGLIGMIITLVLKFTQ